MTTYEDLINQWQIVFSIAMILVFGLALYLSIKLLREEKKRNVNK